MRHMLDTEADPENLYGGTRDVLRHPHLIALMPQIRAFRRDWLIAFAVTVLLTWGFFAAIATGVMFAFIAAATWSDPVNGPVFGIIFGVIVIFPMTLFFLEMRVVSGIMDSWGVERREVLHAQVNEIVNSISAQPGYSYIDHYTVHKNLGISW